jgi:glycosyltransferase involved in cell wall biosynthesis
MRRLAFVSPNFYPRTCGVGDFCARLAHELGTRDVGVKIYSREPVQSNPEAHNVVAKGVRGERPWRIARGIWDHLAQDRPTDLVIQYTSQMWDTWRFGSPALPWLAERARRSGIRVFLIAHEPFIGFPRHRPDLMVASGLQRLQLAALLKSCERTFVTTETRIRYLEGMSALLGVPRPGVVRIGASALPKPRHASPARRLGVFSTASVGKQFDAILAAFAVVAAELSDAELVLIGDLGPRDSARVRSLEEAVRRHPASERIRITGRLELPQVADEIAALDVYFCPMNTGANTRSSSLPTAFGSGVPVVAVKGVETDPSVFVHRRNVLFADDLTGPSLARAALEILRDSTLAAELSAGGRALFEQHLAWPRIADRFLEEIGAA